MYMFTIAHVSEARCGDHQLLETRLDFRFGYTGQILKLLPVVSQTHCPGLAYDCERRILMSPNLHFDYSQRVH